MLVLACRRMSFSKAISALPPMLNWIDNEFVVGSGPALSVINKATGKEVMKGNSATAEDIEYAVSSAERAFKSFKHMTAPQRGDILIRTASILESKKEAISNIESLDTGKTVEEAEWDVDGAVDILRFIGGIMQDFRGDHYSFASGFGFTSREPLGVIGAIGPWNYPLTTAAWKVGPALACGNSMVYKASEYTPLSTILLASIMKEAGAPPGVINIVAGPGATGALITQHPTIAKMSFTGSVPTGKKIMKGCSDSLKKVTLELGGKSPLIIFEDADMDNAVSAAMMANFLSQGAVCSNGTRVFVQRSILKQFTDKLVARVEKMKVGNPTNPDTKVGATICQMQYDKILAYLDTARKEGASVLCGGGAVAMEEEELKGGLYIAPTVLGDCTDEMTVVKEEIFGPVASILVFDTEDEVLERANNTIFGLAAGVCTKDLNRAYRVVSALEAGHCSINTYNNFPSQMPFGGFKMSGMGRELGRECLNYYSQTKTVVVETGRVEDPFL